MNLPDHYHKECDFHVVPCPRCKLPVLRSDIVKHREDTCDPSSTKPELTKHENPSVPDNMAVALKKLSDENKHLQSSVNQLFDYVKSEGSSLREILTTESAKHSESYSGGMLNDVKGSLREYVSKEIDTLFKAVSSAAADVTQKVLSTHSFKQVNWYLEPWSEFKGRAAIAANGVAKAESAAAYMEGYKVVYVVNVEKQDLCCFLKLVPGEHDAILVWPFRKTYKMSVIHPEDTSKTISFSIDASLHPDKEMFHRRKDSSAPGIGRVITTVDVIENGGYVRDDTLHLCLEILP